MQNEWRSMAIPLKIYFSQDNVFCLVICMLNSKGEAKKIDTAGVRFFCLKKPFKMSMMSYTSYDQRYSFTASSGHFLFSLEASTTKLTG